MVRTFLSQVFRYAIPRGLIDRDYAAGVIPKPHPKNRPYANRPWTVEERAVVLDRAAPHIRVAVALIMNTGLNPSDALKLTRRQRDGDTIWGVRGKTGQEVAVPIGPTLQAALDAAPKHDAVTILASSNGKPWTYNGFSTVWYRFKKKLEVRALRNPAWHSRGCGIPWTRHCARQGLRNARLRTCWGKRPHLWPVTIPGPPT